MAAMLAGAFSIAARPFLNAHPFIKPLLYVWVVQNVVLTLSAALRLDLYISEYGLTYLRVYALIWMGLIAVGLLLLLWHILRDPHDRIEGAVIVDGGADAYGVVFLNTGGGHGKHVDHVKRWTLCLDRATQGPIVGTLISGVDSHQYLVEKPIKHPPIQTSKSQATYRLCPKICDSFFS